MQKLLVICGPTATSKTLLAVNLAEKLGGEIISADSRQVYKGMDIGTGKDLREIPKWAKIWGYDLAEPKEEYSVSKYIAFANKAIEDIWSRDKLPILVGGTGLYIKGVVDGIPTALVPKNKNLRKNLVEKGTDELFEILAQQDPIRAASLNTSDRKNPRRLIRAIEIAQRKLQTGGKLDKSFAFKGDSTLFVGLTAPKQYLLGKIDERVEARVEAGVEEEIRKLLERGVSWEDQAMTALGYRQWKEYFDKGKTKEKVISEWKNEERKYAKRQITWFKRDGRINWFNITRPSWDKKVEKLVKKWYSSENAKKN